MHEPHARGGTSARGSDPTDPNTGRVLDGRYRIGGRIARGGMASVYEATDLRLDRTVAVKIMHAGLGDGQPGQDDFADRFVREARAAARLSHPNIVAVYDQGEDRGTVFLAMEYVPGHTLRDTIAKEAPMAPEKALALLDPVLSALAVAHRSGLIHRDVKPENVLIADDGRVKVADFGLAKAVSADTQHTVTQGVLIGTVSYLAPELVVEGIADARVDVYAVGVILYELLTGTKPHTGESPIQVAYAHAHNDVPLPSESVQGIPAYVDALVARATTRDRGLRPADAGVLLHHVRRVQAALHQGLTEDAELVDDLMPRGRLSSGGAAAHEDTTELSADIPALLTTGTLADHQTTQVIERALDTRDQRARRLPPPTPVPPRPPRDQRADGARDGHDGGGRERRWRGPLIFLLILLLAATLGGVGYWFGWARYTTTPDLVNDTRAQAISALDRAELDAEFGEPVYSETVPRGQVVSTDPAPGSRILPHHGVTVVLSRGPELHDLPDLRGKTVAEATAALDAIKMVVSRESDRWSETVPAGQVIATDPAYGTDAAKALPIDSGVVLVVSKGRQPIKVTSRVGDPADEAIAAWKKAGLKVEVTRDFSTSVDDGDIISQDPESATLHKRDVVTIVVSKGPPYVTVPSVWGATTSAATDKLEGLGFTVVVHHSPFYVGAGRAVNTDPKSGDSARYGSTIIVYIV